MRARVVARSRRAQVVYVRRVKLRVWARARVRARVRVRVVLGLAPPVR